MRRLVVSLALCFATVGAMIDYTTVSLSWWYQTCKLLSNKEIQATYDAQVTNIKSLNAELESLNKQLAIAQKYSNIDKKNTNQISQQITNKLSVLQSLYRLQNSSYSDIISAETMHQLLSNYHNLMIDQNSPFMNNNQWVGGGAPQSSDALVQQQSMPIPIEKTDDATAYSVFKPYAQKLRIPAGSKVAVHGDLHGDVKSLMEYLNQLKVAGYIDNDFKIIDDSFYMLFLGDYVDRGFFGIEVIYTILRLKLANPDKVFMVRGNHEDYELSRGYSFTTELWRKYGKDKKALLSTSNVTFLEPSEATTLFAAINHFYDLLPVVMYLGTGNDYVQCCHGGMEIGYKPNKLLAHKNDRAFEWIATLKRGDNYKEIITVQETNAALKLSDDAKKNIDSYNQDINISWKFPSKNISFPVIKTYANLGFMWSDFIVDHNTVIESGRNVGVHSYGKELTKVLLAQHSVGDNKVRGVFRAHQHSNPTIKNNQEMWTPMMSSILSIDDPANPQKGVGKLWPTDENQPRMTTLWDGIVCTFLVSPDSWASAYGKGYNYDAFGLLTTANAFEQWKLQVFRIEDIYNAQIDRSQVLEGLAAKKEELVANVIQENNPVVAPLPVLTVQQNVPLVVAQLRETRQEQEPTFEGKEPAPVPTIVPTTQSAASKQPLPAAPSGLWGYLVSAWNWVLSWFSWF